MSWGEIYNTSWWGVALDTARTVKARPDFFGSQLNLLTSEQPNLVTNGSFDSDSDWTLTSGASISDGSLNFDGTQTGTINVRQTITSLDLTKIYKVTFTVSNYTAGQVKVKISNDAQGTNKTANGTYTEYLSGMANNALSFTANVDFIGSIDNVSVQVARAELDQIEAKKCLADWIHTTALKDLNN